MAENKILVTVVIPVYHVEDYIDSCLNSIVNQNYQFIECIIIDDCGNDKSMEIVHNFIANYTGVIKFVVVKNEKNLGLSSARNEGISKATGSYIYFLDSDDEISPDCLQYMINIATSGNFDLVICNHQSDKNKMSTQSSFEEFSLDGENIFSLYKQNNNAWNRLVKMEIINKYNLRFQPNIYHEDRLWSFILFSYVKSCFVSTKNTYLYNIRPNSIMTDNSKRLKRIYDSALIVQVMDKFMNSNRTFLMRSETINYVNLERFGVCIDAYKMGYVFGKETFNSVYKRLKITEFLNLDLNNKVRGLSFFLPRKIGFLYCIFLCKIYYKQKIETNV